MFSCGGAGSNIPVALQGYSPTALINTVYTDINKPDNRPYPTVLEQCIAEQRYVRESMTRTLLYAQVGSSRNCLLGAIG